MKRRETNGGWEDRLSGIMPDPERLSAVSRSALVRAGSRWLSFARGLSRGRGPTMLAAGTRAFIESLYGGRFKAVEGGAFSLDKVYRTAGGGLFVSETRLSLSLHPRFDLRLLNVAGGRAGSQFFGESRATTLLSHADVSGRGQQRDAPHVTNSSFAAPSLTVQTWNVSQAGAETVAPAFGYVSVRVQRARQGQGTEPARPAAVLVERTVRDGGAPGAGAETSRPTVVPAPASLRLTSLDLRQFAHHAPRQKFVSLLLNTYLPAVVSREVLSVRTAAGLPGVPAREAAGQGATERRFAHAPGTQGRRPSAWTYAEPAPRHAPGGAVEVRREFRSVETIKEHTSSQGARPPLLHLLPPASVLLSLSETSLTSLGGGAFGAGHTTFQLSRHASALTLQYLRTHTAPSGTREGSAAVEAPRLLAQTPQGQPAGTRDLLSSFHSFAERVHSTVAGLAHTVNSSFFTPAGFEPTPRRGLEQVSARRRVVSAAPSSLHTFLERVHSTVAGIEQAGPAAIFTRPVFESVLRGGGGQVSARQRGVSSEATRGDATPGGLFGRSVEFVLPASAAEFAREASTHDAGARLSPEHAPGLFSTQGVTGAGTFLFTKALLRRSEGGAAAAGALSPTAASERASRETRAARPEGMALDLVRQRREEVLRLPPPGYVFTQPARAQLEERQVITKASREEIVEVVRKEVRSLTSSAHAAPAPAHADLGGLADEVYSTLVRRLLVEKERLGRF